MCHLCIRFLALHHRAPQTGWLQQQKLFSPNSGGYKSEINVSARMFFSAASFLGLWVLFPFVPTWSSFCVYHILIFASDAKKLVILDEAPPPHMISIYLNYLFQDPFSKYSHITRYWGIGLQHRILRGTQFNA